MVLKGTLMQRLFDTRSLDFDASSLRFVILSGAKDLLFARVGIDFKGQVTLIKPALAEILPCRLGGTNQSNFFLAQPTFEGFLPRDGVANVLETLAVYKAVNTVFARESGVNVVLVFPYPPLQMLFVMPM
jgi:hypothetical protein